ncbi:MAG: LPS export ABC transporter periplasmic protein LptC [Syntrophobacter sp.]
MAGLSLVLIAGIWKGKGPGSNPRDSGPIISDSEMKLTEIEFTEMEQGKRLWTLHAAEATYYQDRQRTALKTVHMTFYLDNDEEVHLESREGIFNTVSKNVQLREDVRAKLPRGYVVTTERVNYNHSLRTVSSDKRIHLTGPGAQIQGNTWEYKINDRMGTANGEITVSLVLPELRLEKSP